MTLPLSDFLTPRYRFPRHYRPTLGLIAVDRTTFTRSPKESARRLGALSRARRLPPPAALGSVSVPSGR